MIASKFISVEDFSRILAGHLGGEIAHMRHLIARHDYDVYEADWLGAGSTQPLIVHAFDSQRGLDAARTSHNAMRSLAVGGYPVSHLVWAVENVSDYGLPFLVMERLAGSPVSALLGSETAQPHWIETLASLMMRLHRLQIFSWLNAQRALEFAERRIKVWQRRAQDAGASACVPGFEWLRENLHLTRSAPESAMVHFNFSPEYVFAHDDEVTGVTDWCRLAATDPTVDVGWMRMQLITQYGPALGDKFVQAYQRRGGAVPESLPFWEVYAAVKQIIAFAEDAGRPGVLPVSVERQSAVEHFMRVRIGETG